MYSNKENVNILTAKLIRYNVSNIVVCPGSRNAPLVHNFSECPDITCYPVTDERSAAFMALGLRQQLNEPVAVCVTSGSALLNVLPAVAEATYQEQGIIVISADRPQEWIGQLDGQTMPQQGSLGGFVAKSVSLPEEGGWYCSRLIDEAMMAYFRNGNKSVHINVPINEPLFTFSTPKLPEVNNILHANWKDDSTQSFVIRKLCEAKKPLIVLGQLPENAMPEDYLQELAECFVILHEPISTGGLPQSFTDQMLFRIESHPAKYKPDCVLFIGGNTVSKRLRQFLRSLDDKCYQIMAGSDGELHDISQHTRLVVEGNPYSIISDLNGYISYGAKPSAFYRAWETLRNEVKAIHEAFVPDYSSMMAVRIFEQESDDGTYYYGNSMSVRLASIYAHHYCHCNRGLNGIEGSLSVAAGASLANPSTNVYCVIGDLSFFYDGNALWQQQLGGNFRILLLNNGQGGIFKNLEGLNLSPAADNYIAGRHNINAEGICRQFGIKYLRATDEDSLNFGIRELRMTCSNRPVLLEVITDVNEDERVFKEYYHSMR